MKLKYDDQGWAEFTIKLLALTAILAFALLDIAWWLLRW